MADYYKNIDDCGCGPYGTVHDRYYGNNINGIQYFVIDDLQDEPVDVNFFKEHARIDFNTDDDLIEKYIKAARQYLEGWSQLSFGVKTINLKALRLPDNFRLMYGPVDSIITSGHSNFGDILKSGGSDVDIEYITKDWCPDAVKVAICRYAAGLYIFRENVITEINGSQYQDEAKEMIRSYMNVTVF